MVTLHLYRSFRANLFLESEMLQDSSRIWRDLYSSADLVQVLGHFATDSNPNVQARSQVLSRESSRPDRAASIR
jgi:hypothetical protein